MNRTAIAFVVAPLWVPLIVTPYAARHMFAHPGQFWLVAIAGLVSAAFAYGGSLILGLPAFLWLRSRGLTTILIAPILGIVLGVIAGAAFLVCFYLYLGGGVVEGIEETLIHSGGRVWFGLMVSGLLGALVGITLWFIARPDRVKMRSR